MRSRLVAVTLLAAAAGCATHGQVRSLERRIDQLEAAEAKRELEAQGTLLRVEAQLASLTVTIGRVADAADASEALTAQLAEIQKRLDKIASAPPARPPRPEPAPDKTYAVPIADAPIVGSADALVTIVKAYDYACPFCEKARDTDAQILSTYGAKVRIVYEPFVVHPQVATLPAQAACAAFHQGKFETLDPLLWEKAFKTRQFDKSHLLDLARDAGLDMTAFENDLDGACVAWVQKHMATLTSFGVGATPTFFINGRYIAGAQPFPAFQALIDDELQKAQARVKKGTKAKKYYDEWVIKPGLKKLEPPPAAPTP